MHCHSSKSVYTFEKSIELKHAASPQAQQPLWININSELQVQVNLINYIQ